MVSSRDLRDSGARFSQLNHETTHKKPGQFGGLYVSRERMDDMRIYEMMIYVYLY